MNKVQRRIEVSCVDLDGQAAVLFYDLVNEVVLDDPTDFLWSLSHDGQLDTKTVSDAAFTVRRFIEHLDRGEHRTTVGECRDGDIERFRDAELKSVLSSSKSKQNERAAKNSVNARIRLVYRYLTWLQAHGRTPALSIGRRGCRVLSTLPDDVGIDDAARLPRKRRTNSLEQSARYPLAYRRIGANSKHAIKFVPSEQIRYAAISAIHDSASSDYLAHRNALIIDIANAVGWRRESINSITRGQVAEAYEAVATADYASMCPSVQKFGYVETFDVPGWLVDRMIHFSRSYLEPLAEAKQWKLSPKTAFFLGVNGRPLKERSITKIVSKAIRKAGGPRFAAVHAFRRKFTNDEIEDETKYRLEAGLDTTAASIAASVSISLGHHDPDSIYPYVSKSMSAGRLKADAQRREHVALLEQEVVALKEQVKALKGQASKSLPEDGKPPAAKSSRRRR